MKTRVTELLGIEHPLICGAMLMLAEPKLCAAISNAGALGNLTSSNYTNVEDIRAAVREVKSLTDKPFAVNITASFHNPNPQLVAEVATMCADEGVPVIETSVRAFPEPVVAALHERGVKVIHKVGCVKHALHAQKVGYDAVEAVGFEAGGHPHPDDVTTMLLIPSMAEVLDIPIIAGGGIADGRGLAAVLALGAEGAMMATRFALTEECMLPESIKEGFLERETADTALVCKSVNFQGRVLKTPLAEKVLEMEAEGKPFSEFRTYISGRQMAKGIETGQIDDGMWYVGESVGLANDIVSCAELIERIIAEAQGATKRLQGIAE